MKIYMTGYNRQTLQQVIKNEALQLGLKMSDISHVDMLVRPDLGGLSIHFYALAGAGVFDSNGQSVKYIFLANVMI